VVPCTTTDRGLPFHPSVDLGRPSFALCDQLKSISRKRLVKRHSARLTGPEVDTIKFVLRQMIDS
jgi:mRNA interferase MazF